jgi:hypothetical protein
MGPLVVTSGRITLPEALEGQAVTVLEVELAGKDGPFDAERLAVGDRPVESLGDLASLAGVTVLREGDALLFSTDHGGDPRWSEQSAAFWQGLGRFATGGEIHLRGADGGTWSYRYTSDGVQQVGAPPVAGRPAARPHAPEPPPPAPPAPPVDTGEPAGPPPGPPPGPGQPPPAPPWGVGGDPRAFLDPEAPPPRSPGRTAGMAVLLVVGVLLIVAVALLTAGIF